MNRYHRSQFLYSNAGRPVMIAGQLNLVHAVQATLVNQGITLTAVAFGSSGNKITYAITGGGVAGAEVVTVVGNAISIQIQSGVSTITQVQTALAAVPAVTALVTPTGAGGAAVNAPLAPTPLAGGIDGVASNTLGSLVASAARTGVGQYTVTLADNYNSALSCQFQLMAATPVDLVPQMLTMDVVSAKTVVVSLLAGAVPTEVLAPATLFMDLIVNESSING